MKKLFATCLGAATALLLFLAQPNMDSAVDTTASAPVAAKIAKIGLDGYYIEQEEFRHDTVSVRIVRYASHQQLIDRWKEKFGVVELPPGKTVRAFAEWGVNPNGAHCTIHIVDPVVDYQPQFFGHELMHCIGGKFHPTQPRMPQPKNKGV